MKNEPNIEQIVRCTLAEAHLTIDKLMENLKFSQMTFPIFPHFANDCQQTCFTNSDLESSLSQSWPTQKPLKASFLSNIFGSFLCPESHTKYFGIIFSIAIEQKLIQWWTASSSQSAVFLWILASKLGTAFVSHHCYFVCIKLSWWGKVCLGMLVRNDGWWQHAGWETSLRCCLYLSNKFSLAIYIFIHSWRK